MTGYNETTGQQDNQTIKQRSNNQTIQTINPKKKKFSTFSAASGTMPRSSSHLPGLPFLSTPGFPFLFSSPAFLSFPARGTPIRGLPLQIQSRRSIRSTLYPLSPPRHVPRRRSSPPPPSSLPSPPLPPSPVQGDSRRVFCGDSRGVFCGGFSWGFSSWGFLIGWVGGTYGRQSDGGGDGDATARRRQKLNPKRDQRETTA